MWHPNSSSASFMYLIFYIGLHWLTLSRVEPLTEFVAGQPWTAAKKRSNWLGRTGQILRLPAQPSRPNRSILPRLSGIITKSHFKPNATIILNFTQPFNFESLGNLGLGFVPTYNTTDIFILPWPAWGEAFNSNNATQIESCPNLRLL